MVHHTFPYSINKCMGLTSTALHRCPHTCSLGIPTRGRQSGVWRGCRRGKDDSGGGHSGRKTCLTLRKGRQSSFTDRAPPDSPGRPRPGSLRRPCSPPTGRRHATAAAAAASSAPGQPRLRPWLAWGLFMVKEQLCVGGDRPHCMAAVGSPCHRSSRAFTPARAGTRPPTAFLACSPSVNPPPAAGGRRFQGG